VSAEENKALARRLIEEMFNRGNLEAADELFAPDYVNHDPGSPEEIRGGPEGIKRYVGVYRTAFPDLQLTIEDQVTEGDKVATRWTGRGTHQGDLMGIAPTGRRATATGITIDRISGDKVVETWTNFDVMGMMQQLGVIPSPEQAQT
jgi:steroid delta-isomerase-like uncharacterized protein